MLSARTVISALESEDDPVELCFFGGSFARQDREDITGYLDTIRSARKGSVVTFSSYPGDFYGRAGDDLISLLGRYPIGTIELGIPSLNPVVLEACGRHDDPEKILGTLVKLRNSGFRIGVQVMIGLPGQTLESSTADIGRMGAMIGGGEPWDLRIYPCLVLRGTELDKLYNDGAYSPLPLEDAVRNAGALLLAAKRAGFNAIRVGLLESASLRASVAAGPHHPAFGELAMSEAAALEFASENPAGPWRIERRNISRLTGHGGRGLTRLSELTSIPAGEIRDLIILT
jgi:histone acetyltransferase (RNA polymerase elongator complex component)